MNVSPTGFAVVFSTLNAGDTRVRYGPDARQLRESRVGEALTTHHSLTLSNLVPGTTYYVEVSSRNAAGTETATPVPFITAGGRRPAGAGGGARIKFSRHGTIAVGQRCVSLKFSIFVFPSSA